jgi:DNA mismatch repair protein MutS
VLNHAQHALDALENSASASQAQVDLFAPPPETRQAAPSAVEAALAAVNPDALSPREALDVLYQLKKMGGAA